MNKIFSQSEHFKSEYACEVVRIGEVIPIEGSDFLGKVEIHPGMPIVVRKDEVKEGDVMFYVDMECQICGDFLRVNNQYEDRTLNADPEQKGYINQYGRIRMIRLRGQESMGYLFGRDSMLKYIPNAQFDIAEMVGETFDTVNGNLFVKAYVPEIKNRGNARSQSLHKSRDKRLKHFDRLIPGEFTFHYDTAQLEKSLGFIMPNDIVDLSVKLHGTSAIFANILTNRRLSFMEKVKKFFGMKVQLTEYGNIYSSRSVIKNKYYNENVQPGYYEQDIWGVWNEMIKDYIPEGMTLYGEIVGYTTNGQCIQKGYDYGCKPKESKLMIYRITQDTEAQGKYEYNVGEVRDWTDHLIHYLKNSNDPTKQVLADHLISIPVVYHGTLHDLYPEVPVDENWGKNMIHLLANDKRFHMEENEPMCQNDVPREGLVLRKVNDPLKQAFKLKTMKFRNKEAKKIDSGEVDIEMQDAYSQK